MARRQRDYKAEYARRQAKARAEGYRSYGQKRRQLERDRANPWRRANTVRLIEWLEEKKISHSDMQLFQLGLTPYPAHVTESYVRRSKAARARFVELHPDFDWRVWREEYSTWT